MSFYEWILEVDKYKVKSDRQKFEWENGWDQTRRTMSMLGNIFRGKESSPLLPTDIIKLSWDSPDVAINEDPKEVFERLKKRFGSKIKKKNGSE